MPCYHPLKAFKLGVNPDTGKDILKVCKYTTDHLEKIKGEWKPFETSVRLLDRPIRSEFVEIPCGKCLGCRLEKSRVWANRCMMEAMEHDSNYFVTLTYDDDHVPVSSVSGYYSLRKRDMQLFMKRLRANTGQDIRYFLSGEYGDFSFTHRPHYHLLLFGLKLDDLEPLPGRSEQGFVYYRSSTLERSWYGVPRVCSDDVKPSQIGRVIVAKLNWETCAYTARYVMKKLDGDYAEFYETLGIEPEFSLMSRRPGIGLSYFEKNFEQIYETDSIVLSSDGHGKVVKPPRYFDNRFELLDPEKMAAIKDKRSLVADNKRKALLALTDLDYLEVLEVEERKAKNRTAILKEVKKRNEKKYEAKERFENLQKHRCEN